MLLKFSKCVYTAEVAIKADYRLSVRTITAYYQMYVCWSPSSECMNFGKSGKVEKFGSFFFLVKLGDEIRLNRQLILSNKTTLPK